MCMNVLASNQMYTGLDQIGHALFHSAPFPRIEVEVLHDELHEAVIELVDMWKQGNEVSFSTLIMRMTTSHLAIYDFDILNYLMGLSFHCLKIMLERVLIIPEELLESALKVCA